MSDRVEPKQIQLDPGEAARGALIADFASTVKSQFKSLDLDSDNFLSIKELDAAAADSSRPNQQRVLFNALTNNEDKSHRSDGTSGPGRAIRVFRCRM
ncbi:MAG: hypothetical protein IPP57_09960 [Candidatus Obscuribacter sp.]|nr:hypothetical protein [Candidatus Obscuribacter sp.]